MQNNLIELMNLYTIQGKLDLGKKIAKKLIQIDLYRLSELSKVEITESNFDEINNEINAIKERNRI